MQHPLFERILVGVDAEGLSSHAVVRGAGLARRLGARLDLVHAVEVPPPMWPGITESQLASMHANALAESREKALAAASEALEAADLGQPLEDHLRVLPGHPAQVLLGQAEELGADLLVLGEHARRSLLDFGSTARAVLSRSDRPVWNQPGPATDVKSVLVPVDFSDHSRAALDRAHALAAALGASVRVLHCYSPPVFAYVSTADALPGPTYVLDREREATEEQLGQLIEGYAWGDVKAESAFVEGDPVTQILGATEDSDLVVMGTHGRTGLSRFLLGSVAYEVLKQSEVPVLAVPSTERAWLLPESERS